MEPALSAWFWIVMCHSEYLSREEAKLYTGTGAHHLDERLGAFKASYFLGPVGMVSIAAP